MSSTPSDPIVVTVIRPEERGVSHAFGEIWRYRSLFYWLTWRDIKVRYKHTTIGIFWALLQPIALVLVLTFALGFIVRVPTEPLPYPVFILAGLTIWTLFTSIVQSMSSSLMANKSLVSKVYFPRLVLVLSSIGIPVMDFVVMLVLLIAVSLAFGVDLLTSAPLVVGFVLLATLLAAGAGLWLAALNTKYPDTRFIVPVILQVGMFASPVLYPLNLVPQAWYPYLAANPMVVVVEGFRLALFGHGLVSPTMIAVSTAVGLFLLLSGAYFFHQSERNLIDAL
jgi:lipopolysaccharide transport system permease protein